MQAVMAHGCGYSDGHLILILHIPIKETRDWELFLDFATNLYFPIRIEVNPPSYSHVEPANNNQQVEAVGMLAMTKASYRLRMLMVKSTPAMTMT